MKKVNWFLVFLLWISFGLNAYGNDPFDCTAVGNRSAWREGTWKLVPFPDTHAQYLSYQFLIPKNRKLSLRFDGEFPYGLYTSFVVYNSDTEDSLSEVLDTQVIPVPGSKNPYQVGEDRYTQNRSYTVWAYSAGTALGKEKEGALVLPFSSERDLKIDIWFRVYENEKETLPIPQIHAFDGEDLAPGKCPKLAEKEYSIATESDFLVGRRLSQYVKGKVPMPLKDREAHMYYPDSSSLGGNPHAQYLSMRLPVIGVPASMKLGAIKTSLVNAYLKNEGMLQKEIGDVTVLKLKIPAFPDVLKGLPKFTGQEDLRYWSLCLSGHDSSTSDCVSGKTANIFQDTSGGSFAVIVVGEGTPEVKAKASSFGYDFIDRSTQMTPILFYRQMVIENDFEGQIPKVKKYTAGETDSASCYADKYIGEYSPTGRHFQQAEFLATNWKMPGLQDLTLVEKR